MFLRTVERKTTLKGDIMKTDPKTSRRRRRATAATPAAAVADLDLTTDSLLTTKQAAALLGLSPKSLRQMRCDSTGPRCLKLGTTKQARSLYRRSDLERWVRSRVAVVTGG